MQPVEDLDRYVLINEWTRVMLLAHHDLGEFAPTIAPRGIVMVPPTEILISVYKKLNAISGNYCDVLIEALKTLQVEGAGFTCPFLQNLHTAWFKNRSYIEVVKYVRELL